MSDEKILLRFEKQVGSFIKPGYQNYFDAEKAKKLIEGGYAKEVKLEQGETEDKPRKKRKTIILTGQQEDK